MFDFYLLVYLFWSEVYQFGLQINLVENYYLLKVCNVVRKVEDKMKN